MQKTVFILFALTIAVVANTQVVFKTILKKGPVVAGEPFKVQYVIENVESDISILTPDFKNIRLVSGPIIYEGAVYAADDLRKIKNFAYTLLAARPGRYLISGATARMDNKLYKSNDAFVEVISKTEAIKRGIQADAQQSAYLRPGEDPGQKIRNNLFLKVLVDKRTCFVGEPVTATFKLYSSLASRSDIVKNPGFYGFTVQDMVGLHDKQTVVETINGKKFDVHTIRKVQLYPLRAGNFIIDPMEVTNEVKFSKSAVHKETEQEIVEGVFTEPDRKVNVNEVMYENSMNTPAVDIVVKPSPVMNRPADFNGATGKFIITTSINKTTLARNEEGELTIEVSGIGNFTQLSSPSIEWPQGIEGFEPKISDSLDHNHAPLSGRRTFKYPFVSAKPGQYTIPAVSLSFFNPDSNGYKTVATAATTITITKKEKDTTVVSGKQGPDGTKRKSPNLYWLIGSLLVMAMVAVLLWFRKKRMTTTVQQSFTPAIASVTEILQPATVLLMADDHLFLTTLRDCIWKFFVLHFGFSGSKMSRHELSSLMRKKEVDEQQQLDILRILQDCETGMFTGVTIDADKTVMLDKTRSILQRISHK